MLSRVVLFRGGRPSLGASLLQRCHPQQQQQHIHGLAASRPAWTRVGQQQRQQQKQELLTSGWGSTGVRWMSKGEEEEKER